MTMCRWSRAALVFLLLPQLVFICKKCHLLNMSPVAIEYCYYIMLHIKTVPATCGNGKERRV